MVTAPKGINLRAAITQHLSQQQQLEGTSPASRAGALHTHASVLGTPATLPCGLGSDVGTPMGTPISSVQPWHDNQQQQAGQAREGRQSPEGLPPAAARDAAASPLSEAQPEKAEDSATWQWLMQSRFASGPTGSSRAGQPPPLAQHPGALPPQAEHPDPARSQGTGATRHQSSAGGRASAEPAAADEQAQWQAQHELHAPGQGQASWLQRPRATTLEQLELLQDAAPAVRLDGTRPWTCDDAGGPGAGAAAPGVSSQRAQQIEVEYRRRAAARMWPMLAPFVPRLLRQYLVQAHPAVPGDRCASSDAPTLATVLGCEKQQHSRLNPKL